LTRETVNLDAGADGTYTYIYDDEGNRTKRYVADTPNTDVTEYEWDHRNRLVAITHYPTEGEAADNIIEYAYDHGNRWIRKVLDSDADLTADSSTIFVYDGNQIALQFDETGTGDAEAADLSHRYVYGPGTDQIIADEQVSSLGSPGTVLWPLGDHLNTVRDVVDNTASVVLHRVYNAFGQITDASSAIYSLHAFTARPFDPDSLLQNNLHRWYDADTGRWLSEDPIGK
jgi:RHS repeat-associated protein